MRWPIFLSFSLPFFLAISVTCSVAVGILGAAIPVSAQATDVQADDAQPTSAQPASITALRELLASGYYALAAQVDGPQVVRTHPQSAEAHRLYAQALYLVGNYETAAAQLGAAEALDATPEQTRALKHLDALVRAARGDPASGVRLLGQIYDESPDYQVAMDWGQVAWQAGNLEVALRAYRAAATTPQGQREPWPSLNQARLLLQRGDFTGATEILETTLTVLEADPSPRPSPAYAEAFYRLGQAYEALGEDRDAISNYQAASTVDPDYTPATQALERLETP